MSYLLTGARVLTLLFWLTVVGSLFMGLSEHGHPSAGSS